MRSGEGTSDGWQTRFRIAQVAAIAGVGRRVWDSALPKPAFVPRKEPPMTAQATTAQAKTKFIRAKFDSSNPDYEGPDEDDTPLAAMCLTDIAMSGWLECAACGDPKPLQPYTLTAGERDDGFAKIYVYGLCRSCHGVLQDQTHHEPASKLPNYPFVNVVGGGSIKRAVDAALDAFVAAGEPAPAGW